MSSRLQVTTRRSAEGESSILLRPLEDRTASLGWVMQNESCLLQFARAATTNAARGFIIDNRDLRADYHYVMLHTYTNLVLIPLWHVWVPHPLAGSDFRRVEEDKDTSVWVLDVDERFPGSLSAERCR